LTEKLVDHNNMADGRKNNKGTLGNKGGSSAVNDRALAAEVRSLTLNKIKQIFLQVPVERTEKEYDLYQAVLLRLAGNALPRLQYVSDGEGEALFPVPLSEPQLTELLKRRKEAKDKDEKPATEPTEAVGGVVASVVGEDEDTEEDTVEQKEA